MRAVRFGLSSLLAGLVAVASAAEPSAESGRALFIGARAFQAGGAPCGACHAIGGEGMAFTATLGPELSTTVAGMDAEALLGLLDTLPFPTMVPVYDGHALTEAERADLAAFLIPAARRGPPPATPGFVAAGSLVALLLFAGLAANSRRRKPRSRARLVARAYPSQDGGSR